MARTRSRAQRRRRNLWILLALVATLLVVFIARDVSRAAHQSTGPRRSENRSFGVLANALILNENTLNARAMFLFSNGATLSRTDFDARLQQLELFAAGLVSEANELASPHLARGVNNTLMRITTERVADFQTIAAYMNAVAGSAGLKIALRQPLAADSSINQTDLAWSEARGSLLREPGHVRLHASAWSLGAVSIQTADANALEASPSLRVSGGVSINAVAVRPSPLPSAVGELLVPPDPSMHVGVSILNSSTVGQHLTVAISVIPTNGIGTAQSQRDVITIGTQRSSAIDFAALSITPDEKASVVIVVRGANAAYAGSLSRHYDLVVSPSPGA